jgi:polyhydroxyalkanoate synthesis regulator phasin
VNDTTDALSDFFVNSSNVFSNLNTTITTSTAGMTTDVNGSYTVLSDDLIEKIEYLKDELKTQFETIGTNTTTDTDTLIDKVVDSYAELNNSSVEEVKAMKASLKKYFGEMSTDIKTDTSSLTKSATSDFENLQNNSNNKTKVFIENIRKVVDNLKDKIKESMKNAKESVSDSLDEIDKETKNTTISSPTIKTPHLSWSTTSTKAATGVIKSVLEALSLPTSLPSLNVDWYAGGGFPDKGSLFIANEREPELIGNFGNRTAVANNSQIIEGIREASYAGMKQAISESDFGGDTTVYVGNQEVAAAVTKQQKRNDRRFGR